MPIATRPLCIHLWALVPCLLQFFLTLGADIDYLNNKHTVFGEVAEGLDVIGKFNDVFADKEGRPYQDIRCVFVLIT